MRKILDRHIWAWKSLKIERSFAMASPKQARVMGAFFSNRYDVIAAMGGNQSGKTFICSRIFAKHLRDHAKRNSVYWCIAPNAEKSVSKQQKELWDCLPRHVTGRFVWDDKNGFGSKSPMLILYENTEKRKFNRHITVRFKSQQQYLNDPDSFESETLDGIWIDESISLSCYNALQPRLAIKNGFVLISSIPAADWMNDVIDEGDDRLRVFLEKLLPTDNPAMTPEAYARLEASITTEEERQMRLFGNYRTLGGVVYKEFDSSYKKIDGTGGHLVRPFIIPNHWPKWRALDVGMSHPTVCLWITIAPNDDAYVYREYRSVNTSVDIDARRIRELSGDEEYKSHVIIDPSAYSITKANTRSVALQYHDAGLTTCPAAKIGQKISEWALIQNIKRALYGKRLYVFDSCTGLIREFKRWKFKMNNIGEPMGDSFEDRNNDALDALKYWYSVNPCRSITELITESTAE